MTRDWGQPRCWKVHPCPGTPWTANSTLKPIRNTLLSAWLYSSSLLWDSGDCQINDKTHSTSRPEVCSGETVLISSYLESSVSRSAFHKQLNCEICTRADGPSISQGCGPSWVSKNEQGVSSPERNSVSPEIQKVASGFWEWHRQWPWKQSWW